MKAHPLAPAASALLFIASAWFWVDAGSLYATFVTGIAGLGFFGLSADSTRRS